MPFYRPAEDSTGDSSTCTRGAKRWAATCRRAKSARRPLATGHDELFKEFFDGSDGREVSTTMAFVGMLRKMLKDPEIGKLIVPIVPDEARTFGMESLFRTVGIYSVVGQKYEPVDVNTLMYYKEAKDGQILEEGITEAGSMGSFIAAGSAYADARHQHDSVLHLLLDVRIPAHRRFHLGRRGHAYARILAGRNRGPHDACRAKACSTRTATATCSRFRCRICAPTIRRSPTKSPSSSRTAFAACTKTAKTSSTTSR